MVPFSFFNIMFVIKNVFGDVSLSITMEALGHAVG